MNGKRGRKPIAENERRTHLFQMRFTVEEFARLNEIAQEQDTTVAGLIRQRIREYLHKQK